MNKSGRIARALLNICDEIKEMATILTEDKYPVDLLEELKMINFAICTWGEKVVTYMDEVKKCN